MWKGDLYRRERIPEAWIVDHEERMMHVIRPGAADVAETEQPQWHPRGATVPLTIDLPSFFRRALREE